MHFRKQQTVLGLGLKVEEGEGISFKFDCKPPVTVVLKVPHEDERGKGGDVDRLISESSYERDPKIDILEMFESLSQDQMPEASDWKDDIPTSIVDDSGAIKPRHVIPMRWMPKSFRSYADMVSRDLTRCAEKLVHVIRWRIAARCPHNIMRGFMFDYSLDGENWKPFPRIGAAYVEGKKQIAFSDELHTEVYGMVARGLEEPLGHILWQEAWHQRHENARSAIVLGISAAEVGIKQFIGKSIPEARWLIENSPSPPITRLFADYLPDLATDIGIETKGLVPAERTVEQLEKGVQIRNRIVHLGTDAPEYDTLEEILIAVLDLLWLLDVYEGNMFAASNIGELERLTGRAH